MAGKANVVRGALGALTDIFTSKDAPVDESKRSFMRGAAVAPLAGAGALVGLKAVPKLFDDIDPAAIEKAKEWVGSEKLSLGQELNLFTDLFNKASGTNLSPAELLERDLADNLDKVIHGTRGGDMDIAKKLGKSKFKERTWNVVDGEMDLSQELVKKYFGPNVTDAAYGGIHGDHFLGKLFMKEKRTDQFPDLDSEEFVLWLKSKGAHSTDHYKTLQKERERIAKHKGDRFVTDHKIKEKEMLDLGSQ
mgnify:FL=1